ncbi:MAG: hypothetical protein DCF22_24115 [Leptolyngbya sp.]|nr:MAG: hypothetical protein DCF22_24115 [Leptolyngbya sp.]
MDSGGIGIEGAIAMVQATQAQRKSFEEYLNLEDETDNFYELVDGVLTEVTPASPFHSDIAEYLDRKFYAAIQQNKLDWRVKRSDTGVRTGEQRSRLPDIAIIHGEDWRSLRQQKSKAAVLRVPLLLAVEVVSPGIKNRQRDYVEKLKEYQTRKISEYWIVDPQEEKVSIFLLEDELFYSDPTVFTNGLEPIRKVSKS